MKTWRVIAPDGSSYTQPHATSGGALDDATRKWRPRLVARRNARSYDWRDMKDEGYKLESKISPDQSP